MQKLGQHFLKNEAVTQKIIDGLELREDETVIEIGPGHGELSLPLLERCAPLNARVIAIEKDAVLAGELAASENEQVKKHLTIVTGDALKLLPEVVRGLKHYKLVGNIPYYITGKLLRVVSELENKPELTIFLVQHEVAERACAVPPEMNRLAASVQYWAEPSILMFVPKKDFSPPPNVDSSVILLKTKDLKDKPTTESLPEASLYYSAVRGVFAQPRKTLLNNISEAQRNISKETISSQLGTIGIAPDLRPQNLTIEQIGVIAQSFFMNIANNVHDDAEK